MAALNASLHFDRKQYPQGNAGQPSVVSLEKLQRAPVTLRLRHGGETLRPHTTAATRALKNLMQECHVPPWQRERMPLLYSGDELVCVPGVAVAADYLPNGPEAAIQVDLQGR